MLEISEWCERWCDNRSVATINVTFQLLDIYSFVNKFVIVIHDLNICNMNVSNPIFAQIHFNSLISTLKKNKRVSLIFKQYKKDCY